MIALPPNDPARDRSGRRTSTPEASTEDDGARLLERKLARARRVLAIERAWPRLWLPLAIAGLFVLVSLAGLWPLLGRQAHLLALWGFASAFSLSFIPLIRLRLPSREDALKRLERASGLAHRPASSFADELASAPDQAKAEGASLALWRAHKRRLAALIVKLRPGAPNPRTERYDPFALRAALILLLFVGVMAHFDSLGERLRAALTLPPPGAGDRLRIDAWITPPGYTARPPVMLAGEGNQAAAEDGDRPAQNGKAPEVPEGSVLSVRVNGPSTGRLSLHTISGDKRKIIAAKNQKVGEADKSDERAGAGRAAKFTAFETPLNVSQRVELSDDGAVIASWTVTVTDDQPPVISFADRPSASPRGALGISFFAEDDYGVASARAMVRRVGANGEPVHQSEIWPAPDIPLSLPRANARTAKAKIFKDLTAHPWAGLPVEITLEARDQAGQIGRSGVQRLVLPARNFTKPLAKALVEQRRALVDNPYGAPPAVARMLDALTLAPERFIKDKSVYLGIRSAYWRLVIEPDIAGVKSVVEQLWHVALRIEDGDLSDAEQALRTARQKLEDALARKAPEAEIKQLFNELRAALGRFLQAMAKAQQQQGPIKPNPLGRGRTISAQDLDRLLRNIESLAQTGSRDMARQLLSQLGNLLENLQNPQQGSNQRAQQMMSMLDGLSALIQKQQKLLDETFAAHRKQQNSGGEQPQSQPRRGQRQQRPQMGQQGQIGQMPGMPGARGQFGELQPRGRGRAQERRDSRQSGRPGQPAGRGREDSGSQSFGALGTRQDGLRQSLDQWQEQLRKLGAQPPGQLGEAGRAMDNAGTALRGQDGERATQQQSLALERLRQGAKKLMQQAMQQMDQPGGAQQGRGQRDPLGRPTANRGPDSGDSVKVPEEIAIQRAREILQELRRRLGERERPAIELDYLDRLIRRF